MTRPSLARFCSLTLSLALLASCQKAPEPPRLSTLPDFALTSQSGKSFGSAELRGKPWIGAFFFTRCPTVCPVITRRMRSLQLEAQKKQLDLRFVSISVDPENDTPEVLRRYAESSQADSSSWAFLTGDFELIKRTALDGFKLAVEGRADAAAPDFGILHGSHLVLVDGALQIRGYYRSSDDAEMARLLVDAERLANQ
jgi:protein SCO1/2